MLILTRKLGESIMVGDHIRVVVVEVKGRQVRLGVEAPGDTKIYRGEIFERIQEENRRAAQAPADALSKVSSLWTRARSEGGGDAG
ncbi:MAG: carbon storage regulator CsrA [Candidatus Tectomicrobia bacterium]|nr:carbon storage regulator CsrA [Candidatus Tectomicrobia bacterium]